MYVRVLNYAVMPPSQSLSSPTERGSFLLLRTMLVRVHSIVALICDHPCENEPEVGRNEKGVKVRF